MPADRSPEFRASPHTGAAFEKTQWTVVLAAGGPSSTDSRSALEQVMNRLRQEHSASSKAPVFAALQNYLTGETGPGSYAEAASKLNMSEGSVKVALHRLRRRFGELLRNEIAQTVSRPEEIDEEI